MTSQTALLTKLNQEYIKIDPNNKVWASSSKADFLNRAYTQVQKDGGYRWHENQTGISITPVAWTREYSLSVLTSWDFIKLDSLIRLGLPLAKTTKNDVLISNYYNTQWAPYRYYQYGGYLGLDPVPSDSTVIVMQYFKKLPKITSAQDSLLPEAFDDAICSYAAYIAMNSVEKQKAQILLADYKDLINTLSASYLYDDMNISFQRQRSSFVPRDNVIYPGE